MLKIDNFWTWQYKRSSQHSNSLVFEKNKTKERPKPLGFNKLLLLTKKKHSETSEKALNLIKLHPLDGFKRKRMKIIPTKNIVGDNQYFINKNKNVANRPPTLLSHDQLLINCRYGSVLIMLSDYFVCFKYIESEKFSAHIYTHTYIIALYYFYYYSGLIRLGI